MRRSTALAALAAAVLAAAGCGESEGDQAQDRVCEARADVQQRIDALRALTPATVTLDAVQENLTAIQADLRTIADARADLASERREEVEQATAQFTSRLGAIVADIGSSTSVAEARAQVQTAVQDLGEAFSGSLGRIDCS